jgi:hypothetical protein
MLVAGYCLLISPQSEHLDDVILLLGAGFNDELN